MCPSYTPAHKDVSSKHPAYKDVPSYIPAHKDVSSYTPAYKDVPSYIPAHKDVSSYTPAYKDVPSYIPAHKDVSSYTPALNNVSSYTPAYKDVPSYIPALNNVSSYTPAYKDVPSYMPALNNVSSYTPAYKDVPSYNPHHNNVSSYTPAHKDVSSYTPAHKDVSSYTPADKDVPSYTPAHKDASSYTPIHKDVSSYTPAYKDVSSYTPAYKDVSSYSPAHKDVSACTPAHKDVSSCTPAHKDVSSCTPAYKDIGTWNSWDPEGVTINDIVWPGHQHVPPPGVPEKFHLKIVFLEEPPYISLASPDPVTGQCNANRGILCRVATDAMMANVVNQTLAQQNSTYYQCCSGFCIDMLQKFSDELGFSYDLFRVEDGKWGTLEGHKWNGLVAALMNHRADMALSSFKINSERESVVDFTVPYLESGIAIVVAKRTGIISPTAFLGKYDTTSWMLTSLVLTGIISATVFLALFPSPGGFYPNLGIAPPRDHKFSLLRTYWLVWAVLFQAAVHVDCPKGFTARFMANIWAMFAVVFLAIYTANLAAFMITREEYHDLSGIDDHRLQNPYFRKPPFRFGFVPFTNTETIMAKHEPEMFQYMRPFNKSNINDGIKAIKKGQCQHDSRRGGSEVIMVMKSVSYLVEVFEMVKLAGERVHGLDIVPVFQFHGDMERIQRFWLTGACKPKKQSKRASEPLALEQFLSAYLLLFSGVLLALILLLLEHLYFKYVRKHLAKTDSGGCCALISLSMGKSLTFRGAVFEAQNKLRRHRCRDPLCDTHIWKVKHELDMARVKIKQLEKELESHGVKPSRKFATRVLRMMDLSYAYAKSVYITSAFDFPFQCIKAMS
nr:glutamate receptor ionotropic, NMDA 2A-like [Cherax quadricarinatus]